MLTTLAAPAFAGTWYIEDGDITVKAGETEGTNKVSQGANQEVEDTDTIIKNREDTASSNTVTIDAGDDKVEVTLKDVNIDTSSRNKAAVSVTGSGNTTIKLDGDNHLTGGNGSGNSSDGSGISSRGSLTITGGETDSLTAKGGSGEKGGDGICSDSGGVTISGGTVEAAGGSSGSSNGGSGIYSSVIDLSGSLELTAKAGSPNGKALSQKGSELVLDTIKDKLGPGAKVTATDADGKVIDQVPIPRPVEPEESSSSSDGGSAAPSAPAFSLPGLTVTDKDGQRISYTSTQSGNTLTVCVGRLTASLHVSLAALRQLRAEGIETITFQTVLCSTTLSVDELLAMGGEDAEAVLTHRFTDSSLTVG